MRVGTHYTTFSISMRDTAISSREEFDNCVVLAQDTFDPEAVFMDDIVTDDVLPNLNLAVDGLTSSREQKSCDLELRPEDAMAENDAVATPTAAGAVAEPNQLEVYGWESSWWQKVRGYIGF